MNIVRKKLEDSKNIVLIFDDYLNILKPLIEEKYSDEYARLSEVIYNYPKYQKSIEESINELEMTIGDKKSAKFEKKIDVIFNMYKTSQDFYLSIANICSFFNQPYLHSENIEESNLSQTYKLEAADLLSKLMHQYNLFVKKHQEHDAEIVEYLAELLIHIVMNEYSLSDIVDKATDDKFAKSSANIMESIKYIQSKFYESKNTVSLYALFMQELMDYLYSQGIEAKKIMFALMSLIEEDKNFFISGNISNKLKATHKNIHHTNPAYKKFGLIPVSDSLPIDKILAMCSNKSSSSYKSKSDFKKFAADNNCGLIVITKIVFTPVEYNIRPLIIPELAKKLSQPDTYGITSKIVDKYKTIKMHPLQKWNFSYEVFGKDASLESKNSNSTYYVLETLDGTHYRCLGPWLNSKTFAVPKHKLTSLLDYINNDNQPTRVSNYQVASIKKAVPHMFLRRPLNMDTMEEMSKDVDTQIIRNELFLKLLNLINDIIKKDYNGGKKVNSNTDLNDILHDERIQDLFANTLLRLYKVGSKTNEVQEFDAGKFPFYELLSSYMLDLQNIIIRFMRELHDSYNREPIKPETFALDETEKMAEINKKIEQIIIRVLENLISDKENIYSSLNYKYLLLNFN